jgi:hypothetical protein
MNEQPIGRQPLFDARYLASLKYALAASVFLLFITGTMLDMGHAQRRCALGLLGYWVGVVLILLRRPRLPGRGDLRFVRIGLPLMVFVVQPLCEIAVLGIGEWLRR